MPIPKPIASSVLELKNMRVRFLMWPHVVTSYHISQQIQARVIDPKAIRIRLGRFDMRLLKSCLRASGKNAMVSFFEGFFFLVVWLVGKCSISKIAIAMARTRSMMDKSNDNMRLLLSVFSLLLLYRFIEFEVCSKIMKRKTTLERSGKYSSSL